MSGGGPVKELYQFLVEAELEHYYNSFKTDLKITNITQIKYIEDDDLIGLGMSKPEMRRLRKFFKKECPQGTFGKLKKIITTKTHSSYSVDHSADTETKRSPTHVRVPSKHIIAPDAIAVNKTIGAGEFGTVQQGIWTNEDGERIQVAVKGLSKDKMHSGLTEFLKEATNMHSIDHDNIVRLYGVVIDGETLMLVTELAPLRSLLECLKEPSLHASFPVSTLCTFSEQVADGMSYLEGKRLIHRDLAARNILVFAKDKVKISDFGLSRALGAGKDYYQTNFNVNLKLPIAWCAPESINYLKFTSASDVWSYGVTLWEMFSYGFQPWAGLTGQQILDAIDEPNHQRLEQPECCPKDYYQMMTKCWDADPKRRPKFCELVLSLPQIKPESVKAIKDSSSTSKDYLFYKTGDIITVLDKKPVSEPAVNVWRGVTVNGKTGYFSPSDITMFTVDTASPQKTKVLLRKESSVRKGRAGSMISKDMISKPANDLRHTGHIGYDGAVFGDVSFIADNYDKLPVKVVNPYKPQDDIATSSPPLPKSPEKISAPIIISPTESTSGWKDFGEVKKKDDEKPEYDEINDDLDGFKTPDFSLDLDIGTSFMDDFMKAFDDKDEETPSSSSKQEETTAPSTRETTPETPTPREETDTGDEMILKSEKKQARVKPLSASDEKQLDSAIELANQFDAMHSSDVIGKPLSPTSPTERPDSEQENDTPRQKPKFSFKLSKKASPKQERRTFTEEMESKQDGDILSPEAEEAYNMLVVKGSIKKNKSSLEDIPGRSSPKNSPRSVPRGIAIPITQGSPRNGSPQNGRRLEISGPILTGQVPASGNNTHEDSVLPKPPLRVESLNEEESSDGSESENRGQSRKFQREERVRRSMEHHRNSLSDHSDSERKDKNLKQPSGIPSMDNTESTDMNPLRRLRDGGSIVPVPRPRNARQGGGRVANIPLTDSSIRVGAKTQSFVRDRGGARSRLVDQDGEDASPVPLPPKRGSMKLPALPDSDSGSSTRTAKPPTSLPLPSSTDEPTSSPLPKRFNLQNVKCNPEQLGMYNDWDLFWTKNVTFEPSIDEDGMPTMNAKYKTSENVSYEDLMDFAMDDDKYSAEQKDLVQELQKVLSKQVTPKDCLEALEATEFNFQKAVKYVKLKQLLSLQLGDVNRCKEALMRCKWRIEEAADYLLNNPLPSPECVDV